MIIQNQGQSDSFRKLKKCLSKPVEIDKRRAESGWCIPTVNHLEKSFPAISIINLFLCSMGSWSFWWIIRSLSKSCWMTAFSLQYPSTSYVVCLQTKSSTFVAQYISDIVRI